jgi:hypothetical protein
VLEADLPDACYAYTDELQEFCWTLEPLAARSEFKRPVRQQTAFSLLQTSHQRTHQTNEFN